MNAWEKIRKAIRNKSLASLSEICFAAELPLETVTETLAERDDIIVKRDNCSGDHVYSLRDFPPSLRAEAGFVLREPERASGRGALLKKEGIECLPGAAALVKTSDIVITITAEMKRKVEEDRHKIRHILLGPSPRA